MKKVKIGSEVLIRFGGNKEVERFFIDRDPDIFQKKVSPDSPFGQAILERKAKEKISYPNHSGEKINCEIIIKIN